MLADDAFELVDEQPEFIVIHKAPGVPVQATEDHPGLVTRCRETFGEALVPVHRLDRVTSGLFMLARSKVAASILGDALSRHQVRKVYMALSDRKPKKKQGWVIGDMVRSRRGTWRLLRTRDNPAITRFHCVSVGPGLRLFLLFPETGKTHQLRVALKSLGAPVLGDPMYGATSVNADRCYLHAAVLDFSFSGRAFHYTCRPQHGIRFSDAAWSQVRNVLGLNQAVS